MSAPRGFGRNYFSLASIQAHSVAVTQHILTCKVKTFHIICLYSNDRHDDDPPDELLEDSFCTFNTKPCHCNYRYKQLTRLVILACRILHIKNCNCRFYSFRRSGVHPPFETDTMKIIIKFLYIKDKLCPNVSRLSKRFYVRVYTQHV